MKSLIADTDEQMLAVYEHLLRSQTAARCRRALLHDFRNPSQAIQSGLELLERVLMSKSAKVSPEQCIALIRQSLGGLQRAMEKTLDDVAPLESGPADSNLQGMLQEISQLLLNDTASRAVTLRIDVSPQAGIHGTRSRIRQILLCLILDALDALNAEGDISISSSMDAKLCTITIRDTPARTATARASSFESGGGARPLLTDEQWWDAVCTLAAAEGGQLTRTRHDNGAGTVQLTIPAALAQA